MTKKRGLIFVVSGPSGSGKTTLIKSLFKDGKLKKILTKSISFTTRPKRKSERDKKEYFFITPEQFKGLRKRKKIIEWTMYLDHYYGTPKDYLEEQLSKGGYIVLCLDIKGAAKIKDIYPHNTVTVFILPPEIGALRQRMHYRSGVGGEKKLAMRLSLAKQEISASRSYDYRIINDSFQLASKDLKKIIREKISSTGGDSI